MKLFKKKPKHMDNVNFFMCMSKSRRDTNQIDSIGVTGSQGAYEVSFYGLLEDNYELIVENFGYTKKKKRISLEPTETQLKVMRDQLEKHVDIVHKIKHDRAEQRAQDDKHESDMQATYDFINSNRLSY